MRRHGELAFIHALTRGQYTHPDGLYYGGTSPTWSNLTLRRILHEHAGGAERVGLVDLHSGLGPFGWGSVISLATGSHELARVRQTYGSDVAAPLDHPESVPAEVRGHVLGAAVAQLPSAEVLAVALEFGTYSADNDTETYRAMLWLRDHGDRHSDRGRRVIADFRRHFYPADNDWKQTVWERTQEVLRQGVAGLIRRA